MCPTKRWAASLVLGAVGAGCLQASALPQNKSELQKMREIVADTKVIDTTSTRQAALLQGAAAQHLLAATAGVPIFGMSDLVALDQIAGDPSGYSDLASLLQGVGSSIADTGDASNQAVADTDSGADANLDNGGESTNATASPDLASAYSGNVNNSAGGDAGAGGSGGGGSASNFSEGGGGAVTPLPAGAWAALLAIPALALGCRARLRRTAR
jgi:uncharacterized membrane protein YgcG